MENELGEYKKLVSELETEILNLTARLNTAVEKPKPTEEQLIPIPLRAELPSERRARREDKYKKEMERKKEKKT